MPKRQHLSDGNTDHAQKRIRLQQLTIDEKTLCEEEPLFTCYKCIVSGSLTKMIVHLSEEHGPVGGAVKGKYHSDVQLQSFQCNACQFKMASLPHFWVHFCRGGGTANDNYEWIGSARTNDMQFFAKAVGDLIFGRQELILLNRSTSWKHLLHNVYHCFRVLSVTSPSSWIVAKMGVWRPNFCWNTAIMKW